MNLRGEQFIEGRVTYTLEHEGRFYIVHNVPARVNEETGEQFFSPATVDRLHRVILGHENPTCTIETPVYEYADERGWEAAVEGWQLVVKPSSGENSC